MEIEVKLFATLRDYLPQGSSLFSCRMEIDGQDPGTGYLGEAQDP